MTYLMSDLHGECARYLKMLEKIRFSDQDILYLLGDLCDRGPESARIYLDVMKRKNVRVIKGNHEMMADAHLMGILKDYPEGASIPELFSRGGLGLWLENGGDTTLISLFDEKPEDRRKIAEFIRGLPYYRTVEVGGVEYILVHGGIMSDEKGKSMEDFAPRELVWSRPDFDRVYFKGEKKCLIVGHTPTLLLQAVPQAPAIYYGRGNVIDIDCGAAYPEYGGRLGCLCLESMEEFYVD